MTEKVLQVPATITITGELALKLSEYIQNTPSPTMPVGIALKLLGGLELALRAGASNGAAKQPSSSDVMSLARQQLAEQDGK